MPLRKSNIRQSASIISVTPESLCYQDGYSSEGHSFRAIFLRYLLERSF
jgi:hypothetical protein